MVVVNITNKDLKIPEIRSIVPADGKQYILPYDVAIKYKHALAPIQMQDRPAVPSPSTEPINKQIQEMNQNAVESLNRLERELQEESTQVANTETKVETKVEDKQDDWDKLSKQDKIKQLWENNPSYTIVKIAEYSGCSYIYAQKIVAKLKKLKEEEDE